MCVPYEDKDEMSDQAYSASMLKMVTIRVNGD